MPQRFTIEDIEVQDSTGVIFRATDTETGRAVAVRRFFPFGPTGGGLTADEQGEYASALGHLESIAHPALRSIISGGCDPVDGIPFIATEWIEGKSLKHLLAERPLSRPEATALLLHALEACEALSAVLGREGVWIETDPQTIIIGAEDTQRPITFWISPLRWLGQLSGQKGMDPLVTLTETAMGWSGKPPDSHGAGGVAVWLKWLREAGNKVSLAEVRDRLLASVGKESGLVSPKPVQQATRAVIPNGKKARKKSNALAWILAVCVLTAVGLVGCILILKKRERVSETAKPGVEVMPLVKVVETQHSAVPAENSIGDAPASKASPSRPGQKTPEQATREAAEATARRQEDNAAKAAQSARIRERGGILTLDDQDVLLEMKGSWVAFEATLMNTRFSDSGKTFYLEFSSTDSKKGPQGVVTKQDFVGGMTPEFFERLIGQKIRIKGESKRDKNRPEIAIKNLRDVEVVP